jgi:hypothetical protein
MPVSALADPAAIRVSVSGSSISVGSTAAVVIEFLDGHFKPVKNDRDRTVRLEVLQTGGAKQGQGQVTPSSLRASAGQSILSLSHFIAKAPGTVLVRATSDGLAPGEVVVRIAPNASALSQFFFPTVSAQERRSFELLPRTHEPFPLNHKSTAQFSIFLDTAAPVGRRITYRLDTHPAVPIVYREQSLIGSMIVEIEGGQYQSAPILVLPASRPGFIRVRAEQLPSGPVDDVTVEFVAPQPVSVSFERDSYTATSDDRVVPLNVLLRDKDGIPLEDLPEWRDIRLACAGGSSVNFEPSTITFSPGRATGASNLHLGWFRL